MNLSKFLKTGSLIELEVDNPEGKKPLSFHVLIDKTYKEGSFSISTPMKKGRNYPLKIDSIVKIIFFVARENDRDSYAITCKVINKSNTKKFNTLVLQKLSDVEKVQRRAFFRFSIVQNINFFCDDTKYDMLTVNISATGLRGITTKKLPDGEIIKIILPLENKELILMGEVVNSSLVTDSTIKYDVRISFPNITENQKSKITNFIFIKQSEMVRKSLDRNGNNSDISLYNYEDISYLANHSNDPKKFITPISLLLTIILVSVFIKAMPEKMNGLDMFFHYIRNSSWKVNYLYATLGLSLFQILFSAIGISIKRQYSNRINITLLVNIAIAFIFIITFFIILATNDI